MSVQAEAVLSPRFLDRLPGYSTAMRVNLVQAFVEASCAVAAGQRETAVAKDKGNSITIKNEGHEITSVRSGQRRHGPVAIRNGVVKVEVPQRCMEQQ